MRFVKAPWLGAMLGGLLVACGGRLGEAGRAGEPRSGGTSGTGDADASGTGAAGRGTVGRGAGSGSTQSSNGGGGAPVGSGGGHAESGGASGRDSGSGGQAAAETGGAPEAGAQPGTTGNPDAGSGRPPAATEVWVGEVQVPITFGDDDYSATTPEHVVLVVATTVDGVSASVVFGDRQPPPKATDPDANYPLTPDQTGTFPAGSLMNGFPYTLLGLRIDAGRLTASMAPGELWTDWCAMQPKTYPDFYGTGYQCAPKDSPVNPLKGYLCNDATPFSGVCQCDQATCHANLDVRLWQLDLQLKDGAYEGEVTDVDNAGCCWGSGVWLPGVRLRRVQ